ncbi:flagellar protein FliO/FliZ [Oxalobacteraceae bacterium GrIS 2.11]
MNRAIFLVLLGCCTLVHAADATDNPTSGGLLHIILSLLLVVGLLVGASYLFKKFGINRVHGPFPVKVIGATSIGNNQRLVVIEVGDEWILLGVTPQNITTITKMPRQEAPPEAGNAAKPDFAKWMQGALEKYHAKKP